MTAIVKKKTQPTNGQDYRNRSIFDGRPVCTIIAKGLNILPLLVELMKRQYDNRTPRIPFQPRPVGPNTPVREDRACMISLIQMNKI